MAGDDAGYEFKSVQTMRGMEARTMAKLQGEGWEFVTQSQEPLLRTKMTFRRVKPKQRWLGWGVGAGALLLIGMLISSIHGAGGTPEPTTARTAAAVMPSEHPTDKSAQEPTENPEPSKPVESALVESQPGRTLTVKNNAELAALLTGSATGGNKVEGFAAKYEGKLIEFDGNIAAMNNHGDYKTRYDILISAGDYSATASRGPNFQFRDVNIVSDLNLTGKNIPDTLGRGSNLHIIAQVEDFNSNQELFFLKPISTVVR